MLLLRVLVMVALAAAAFPLTAEASDACEPYPVARCGAYDRESITFCFRTIGNRMIDATDKHVIAIGSLGGVDLPDNNAKGVVYLRLSPTEAFAKDPYESDVPLDSLISESNNVRGVQLLPFKCATFEWWAECDSWMMFNVQPTGAGAFPVDTIVV